MKEIICYSKTYGNQTALIDDSDFESINKFRWNVKIEKLKTKCENEKELQYKFYAQTLVINGKKRSIISMHQMILGKVKKGFVIDHIDGNSLNNTRANLRKVTHQQNNQNKKPKNKYKGVSWETNKNKYRSCALGQYIGRFEDEKTAAIEYDKYIIRNLGPESYLNFSYSQEEIDSIKNEIIINKKERDLPDYISLRSNNTFKVKFSSNILNVCKTFEKLDTAIAFKNKCLEKIKEIKDKQLKNHYKKPITYNKEGIAYIKVRYKENEYECLVDEDKWHDLSLIGWYLADRYVVGNINDKKGRKSCRLHRYLYQQYMSDIDITDKIIDHIEGKDQLSKRLDNRMSNLRIATACENAYNIEKTNKCNYRGVQKVNNKYRANISYNNERYSTSVFDTVEEAAIAYNELAKKYYGDKAKLNDIKIDTNK
jgi:hypothetical protein